MNSSCQRSGVDQRLSEAVVDRLSRPSISVPHLRVAHHYHRVTNHVAVGDRRARIDRRFATKCGRTSAIGTNEVTRCQRDVTQRECGRGPHVVVMTISREPAYCSP